MTDSAVGKVQWEELVIVTNWPAVIASNVRLLISYNVPSVEGAYSNIMCSFVCVLMYAQVEQLQCPLECFHILARLSLVHWLLMATGLSLAHSLLMATRLSLGHSLLMATRLSLAYSLMTATGLSLAHRLQMATRLSLADMLLMATRLSMLKASWWPPAWAVLIPSWWQQYHPLP